MVDILTLEKTVHNTNQATVEEKLLVQRCEEPQLLPSTSPFLNKTKNKTKNKTSLFIFGKTNH